VQGIQLPASYTNGTTTVPVAIYDPSTGSQQPSGSPSLLGRTQFVNNFIPLSQISPAALDYLKILNGAVHPFAPYSPNSSYNYTNNADGVYTRQDIDAKFTYLPNSKSTVWGRYSISTADILDPPSLGTAGGNATNGGQQGNGASRIQVVGIGATYAFSPSVILDGNIGYTRQRLGALNLDNLTSDNFGQQFGIPGTNGSSYLEAGYPAFFFSNAGSEANLGDPSTGNPFSFHDNEYTGDTNLSWQKNTHAIRFGFEVIHWGLNHFQPEGGTFQTARGSFGFNGDMTSDGPGSTVTAYNAWADFLLGLPYEAGKANDTRVFNTERESSYAWYVRDQWQATSKLTVSYGARVEWYPFMTQAPFEGQQQGIPVFNPATGQVIIGGNGGTPVRDGVKTPAMIVPRFGLAYRLTPKTVIRSGYGISVDPSNFRNLRDAYPSDELTSNGNTVTTGTGQSYSPVAVLSAPAAGAVNITCNTTTNLCNYGPYTGVTLGIVALPSFNVSSGSIVLANNTGTTTVPLDYRRGYIQSWNLTVQRELGAGFNWNVAYVRTLGIREQGEFNENYANPGGGTSGEQLNAAFPTLFAPAATTWGGITEQCACGTSTYNGLQTQLSRKLGHGGFIGVTYTYSKTIDTLNSGTAANYGENGYFFEAPAFQYRNRADSGFDQTNNLQIFGVEQSPFGKDGRWIQHGFAGKLMGGWQLNEVLSKYSGFPFSVTGNGSSLNAPGNSQTANYIAPITIYGNPGPPPGVTCTDTNTACDYFSPTSFASVLACSATGAIPGACGTVFGTAARNEFRGPGLFNLDMSLGRTFPIHEQMSLMLQLQAFSITNTPHFANPQAGSGIPNAGNFGQITSTLGSSGSSASSISSGARQLWVTAKFTF
jgi:hypothetical protein